MIDFSDIGEVAAEVERKKPTEELIEMAIMELDNVCDGARTLDGVGFAGMHTRTGKKIAKRLNKYPDYKLTRHEIVWAQMSLGYYLNTQLSWLKKDFKEAIMDAYANAAERERNKCKLIK